MMAQIDLHRILDELERRQQSRNLNKPLRDTSDPLQLPEETFRQLYRLNRVSALELFHKMEPYMENSHRNTKTPKVIKFITAMHFFGHGSYQKSIGKDHHCALSQASVSRCITEVVSIMNDHLLHRYIQFPTQLQQITNVKNGFFENFLLPGVIGCIDCTHIAITPPSPNNALYPVHVFMNRKGFYSINCQIICDSNLKIININARYPGSVHNSAIWMLSNINQFLRRNYLVNNDHTTWLLGDSGYPLQPFLLTSIVGAEANTPEGRYTRRHCATRNCVERCIGVLKAYFRCLHKDRVLHYKPPIAAKIVYSCAVLYNILRDRNIEDVDVEQVVDNEILGMANHENEMEPGHFLAEGRLTRNNLIAQHFA